LEQTSSLIHSLPVIFLDVRGFFVFATKGRTNAATKDTNISVDQTRIYVD
jgi:hypothetical protein